MSALHLVKPQHNNKLTIEELLGMLTPDTFSAIEAKARTMRETFHCPYTVKDYDAFKDVIYEYFLLYQETFFNAIATDKNNPTWRDFAYEFAVRNLTKYNPGLQQRHARDLHEEERNSIAGRNGGMISVIDQFTDAIINLHHDTHVHAVFFDHIAPSDYATRMRLADELLKKCGHLLFPGTELLPYYMLGMNLEEVISSFLRHLRQLHREWRH